MFGMPTLIEYNSMKTAENIMTIDKIDEINYYFEVGDCL